MQHGPTHASCEQGISTCRATPQAAAVNKMRQNHCRTPFLFSVDGRRAEQVLREDPRRVGPSRRRVGLLVVGVGSPVGAVSLAARLAPRPQLRAERL